MTLPQLCAYLDGELAEASAEPVRRHLSECHERTERFAGLEAQDEILMRLLDDDPDDEFFRSLSASIPLGRAANGERPAPSVAAPSMADPEPHGAAEPSAEPFGEDANSQTSVEDPGPIAEPAAPPAPEPASVPERLVERASRNIVPVRTVITETIVEPPAAFDLAAEAWERALPLLEHAPESLATARREVAPSRFQAWAAASATGSNVWLKDARRRADP